MHAPAAPQPPFGRGRLSAGILPYRRNAEGKLEVLLLHPGGPFFAKKDAGVWTLGKGQVEQGETPFAAALREFQEETGFAPPPDEAGYRYLGEARYPTGKRVMVWARAMPQMDPAALRSNLVAVAVGGRTIEIPEIDRAAWYPLDRAREKVYPPLLPILERLETVVEREARAT